MPFFVHNIFGYGINAAIGILANTHMPSEILGLDPAAGDIENAILLRLLCG